MFIQWSEKYSLSIPTIDDQHKKLIEIFNNLNKSLEEGGSGENYFKTLKDLADYASYHFSTEEKFMEKFCYNNLEFHKSEHREFIKKIEELEADKLILDAPYLAVKTINFLWDWLARHIQGTDKQYAPLLLKNNVK